MYPVPGHLAFSILGNRYFQAEWIPIILGVFTPDLIDKPLNDILFLTPHGRCVMHSLAGLVAVVGIVYYFTNWKTAYSYGIGHFSHLLADADFIPWFWPFLSYQYPSGIDTLDLFRNPMSIVIPSWIAMESILVGLAVFLYSRYAQNRSIQAAILLAFAALSVYRITRIRPGTLHLP